MLKGLVYLICKDKISVRTEDNKFFKIRKRGGRFEEEFKKCTVGSTVEWESTTHFKVTEVGSNSVSLLADTLKALHENLLKNKGANHG